MSASNTAIPKTVTGVPKSTTCEFTRLGLGVPARHWTCGHMASRSRIEPFVARAVATKSPVPPDMITEAIRNARAGAERFAADSGSKVGSIQQAKLRHLFDNNEGGPTRDRARTVARSIVTLGQRIATYDPEFIGRWVRVVLSSGIVQIRRPNVLSSDRRPRRRRFAILDCGTDQVR
jgi:hypothetical protein